LSAKGVNVGLGTGSAAVAYRLDLFGLMRSAGLEAPAALRAATLGGAQAVGLANRIGSIEPGKAADLAAIFLGTPRLQPCHDPLSHVVHVAGREDVSHVWAGGRLVLADGRLQNPAFSRLDTSIDLWQNPLARAGS
jgi:5-methylthioadenosine/S-adenosylhomocysteine deaminase